MKEFHIDQTLTLVSCEAQELELTTRFGGQFGIIMIMEGEGVFYAGGESWHYENHRVFLFSPGQNCHFTAFYKTTLLTIFFDPFRIAGAGDPANGLNGLFRNVQDIFSTLHLPHYKEFQDDLDRVSLTQLSLLIEHELIHSREASRDLLVSSVSVIVGLMARNLGRSAHSENLLHYNDDTSRVLAYVRTRLREYEHLTIQEIAVELKISQYNLNKLIIKGTGETLRAIIARYRTELLKGPQFELQ